MFKLAPRAALIALALAPPFAQAASTFGSLANFDAVNDTVWVKIVQTTLPDNVDLSELMGGHNAFENPGVVALGDKPETEIEWQALQPGFVDEVSKSIDLKGDPSLAIRYEFYKYKGSFDGEGRVDPTPSQTPVGNALNDFVGDYVGEQIAGFNAVQAVPEPGTGLLLSLGAIVLGCFRKTRHAAARNALRKS